MSEINPWWLVAAGVGVGSLPILVCLGTSYLKISIVLGMLRGALGTQHVPGPLLVTTMSLALTAFIMAPQIACTQSLLSSVESAALSDPSAAYRQGLFTRLLAPWRDFMEVHTDPVEREALAAVAKGSDPVRSAAIFVLAFMLSELKAAFTLGVSVLIPFVVVDLVVANILVAMGMFMVSPTTIALPLKLLLFVLADGWSVLTQGLLLSYGEGASASG